MCTGIYGKLHEVRNHHVRKKVATNTADFAVAVLKDGTFVGHVP